MISKYYSSVVFCTRLAQLFSVQMKKKMLSTETGPDSWNSVGDDQCINVLIQSIRRMSGISFGACSLSSLLTSSNTDLKLTQTPNAQFCHSEHCTQDHNWPCGFVVAQVPTLNFLFTRIFQTEYSLMNKDVLFLWPQPCSLKNTHDKEHLQK